MNTIWNIAKQELRQLFRNPTFGITAFVLFLLLLVALYASYQQVRALNKERLAAQQLSRKGWLMQPPKNPHSAAHFGNFAFRIKSPLSLFDNGLDTYTGTYLFLEPHKQNGDKFSQAEESTTSVRFGELTPAMVLRVVMPLLIVFVCFGSISKEKENNTLKLLLIQGASMRQLVAGRIFGNCIAFASLLVLFFLVGIITLSLFNVAQPVEWGRLWVLLITFLIYTAIWISISVLVSAWSVSSKTALMKLLCIWILATIIVPKIAANAGSVLYPTPSQFQFAQWINKDVEEGLDGHNPFDQRRDALLAATMKKYHVMREEDLPVNFDAIAMIESEKYTTEVFRKRKALVDAIFKKQNDISEWTAFLNPSQAMQYSSMALCGTDYAHFSAFQQEAENYRLYFVNTMNEYMSTHTKSGDWDSRFGKELYEQVKPFTLHQPSLAYAFCNQPLAFVALLCWSLICWLLSLLTNKIQII